ncbi:extracellular solute-binding protein [[Clostridium] polysaccharolyticum]|uniref:Carbohydrate ABC transporter substrate-binding protein, CUT1 family n=1 Tax=[Clostridium] polysaccharolyticum TaxID=29364 RepID=A0A1I0FVL2_9FIRM|nr:extracellular solute-binding protein [[Clostridium] polysaccharolyticum]SET62366.1 carbohydrate ABC transporter substrate-binding protein, CUT1 family [[Clostridium] polysaccharolyticum]
MRKWMYVMLIGLGAITFIGCRNAASSFYVNFEVQEKEAQTTPFGRYPEEVVYTLGKMTGANNSNMPKGDTYEDNAYTRYLKEKLNIQNENVFEEGADYDNVVSMAITAEDIPDVLVVSNMEQLQMLIEKDLIEDLSEVYDSCASETIKDIYKSYGEDILNNVTVDGKLMALPETNIEDGPSLLWLRKDWMEQLGLSDPKTMEDVENIIGQFIEKDPGHNGEGNTIGLVCDSNIVGEAGYNYEYQMDIVFASCNAYPKQFIYGEDGELVYGSVQPEAKKALRKLRSMCQAGTLDSKFLLRSTENIIDLIVSGKCGSFFGPWWAPNNPLIDAKRNNKNADWEPYLIETDKEGVTSYVSQNPSYKYVVVRKGYEHPEIVMKIVSVLFDYARFHDKDAEEISAYFKLNVDPTARPLAINVDYADAIKRCYRNLTNVLNGKKKASTLERLEKSYYDACRDYVRGKEDSINENWAAYTSRIKALEVTEKGKTKQIKSMFFGETETMKQEWWKLERLEEETYLQIITGEAPLKAFDEFSQKWKEQGGQVILEEVNKYLKEKCTNQDEE